MPIPAYDPVTKLPLYDVNSASKRPTIVFDGDICPDPCYDSETMTLTIGMSPLTMACPAGTSWWVNAAGVWVNTNPILNASCTVTLHRKAAFAAVVAAAGKGWWAFNRMADSDWGALGAVTLVTNADASAAPGFRPENILVMCPLKDPATGLITSFGIQMGDDDIFMSERGCGNADGTGCSHLCASIGPSYSSAIAYGWRLYLQPCGTGLDELGETLLGRTGSLNLSIPDFTATLECG